MKKIFLFSILTLLLCSCTGYRPQDSRSTRPETKRPEGCCGYYRIDYDIILTKVERPENAKSRYGEQKIDIINDSVYKTYFEDDMIKILFLFDSKQLLFLVSNKTSHSIKIPWDESVYIDENNVSHRVIHTGVKYNDKEKPQAPSIIASNSIIQDLIYPADFVTWNDRDWRTKQFFSPDEYSYSYSEYGMRFKSRDSVAFSEKLNENLNKQASLLLPFEIEGTTNDYLFTFTVSALNWKISHR